MTILMMILSVYLALVFGAVVSVAITTGRVHDVAVALTNALVGIGAFVLAPVIALFQRGRYIGVRSFVLDDQEFFTIRREWALPLLGTPDEPYPAGFYEGQISRAWVRLRGALMELGVKDWLACDIADYGVCVLWLWRNSAYGLAWAYAVPVKAYLRLEEDGFVESGTLWRWQRTLGPVKFMAGWKVHRRDFLADPISGPLVAIPFVSVRRAK